MYAVDVIAQLVLAGESSRDRRCALTSLYTVMRIEVRVFRVKNSAEHTTGIQDWETIIGHAYPHPWEVGRLMPLPAMLIMKGISAPKGTWVLLCNQLLFLWGRDGCRRVVETVGVDRPFAFPSRKLQCTRFDWLAERRRRTGVQSAPIARDEMLFNSVLRTGHSG
jgi:hypothetical protein